MSVTASTEGRPVSAPRTMGPMGRAFASPKINGILFTLPAIILVLLVIVLPLLQSFYFSFTDWKGARADWIGIGNYTQIFADPELRKSLINSMLIFISIPFGMIGPFVTAYLLYQGMPGARFMRSLIFAPTALSWIVIGMVAREFFASRGPLNATLDSVGLQVVSRNWLADFIWALPAVIIAFNAAMWGVNTIIFLTGLATIDKSTIEAARLDGANGRQVLTYIILPSMRRFVEFVFIITVVISFTGLFGLIYVMTGGGPGSATMTLDFAVWRRAFSTGSFGTGAAIGISLMILTLLCVGLIRFFSGKRADA
jgi:multiple sugar transport system permease protein